MTCSAMRVRSFFEMMAMAVKVNRHAHHFSNELLLSIFWEQTCFRNMEEPSSAGPRTGFALLCRDTIRPANWLHTGDFPNDTTPYSPAVILHDDLLAVAAAADSLEGISRMNEHISQVQTLDTFAGKDRAGLLTRWRSSETELKSVLQGFTFDPLKWDPLKIEGALRKARPFPSTGPEYYHVHEQLFPFQAILGMLVHGEKYVAQGALGRAVWGIQELMNQAAHRQPRSTVQPLLAVDGFFGPRTADRVREFQCKNKITPDGVVGPQTREKLFQLA